MRRAITATRRFGVSILAAEQLDIAAYGSAPGATKFLEQFTEDGGGRESPVVAGALAHLDCELSETVQIADHTVFFGRVRAARASRRGTPLLYHHRAYQTLDAPARHNHRPEGTSDVSRVDSQDRTRATPRRARRGTRRRNRPAGRHPRPRRELPLRQLRRRQAERLLHRADPGSARRARRHLRARRASSPRAGSPAATPR